MTDALTSNTVAHSFASGVTSLRVSTHFRWNVCGSAAGPNHVRERRVTTVLCVFLSHV